MSYVIVHIIQILFNGDLSLWLYFALFCWELLLFIAGPGPWEEQVSNLTIGWLSLFGLSSLSLPLSLSSLLVLYSYYFKYSFLLLVLSQYGSALIKLSSYSNFKYCSLDFNSGNSSKSGLWILSVSLLG